MKCPVCPESVLVMTERQGVEIDYCPSCRGVWLDRGELDKLVEKASARDAAPQAVAAAQAAPQQRVARPDFVDSDYRHRHGQHGQQGHYRKKSWLSEIFD